MFRYIQEKASCTVLYQVTDGHRKTALYPWLVVNLKWNYVGKQKKETIHSIGLHLINGIMTTKMMDKLANLSLDQTINDYSYTLSPIIKPSSGYRRLFDYAENNLLDRDEQWVKESVQQFEEEKTLLDYFYQNNEDEKDLYQQERSHLEERLLPKIKMEVINAGLFYLTEQGTKKMISS
ncbi:YqhG family protein [Gracilibacillus halophilus]|uniref:YqhG family protein n=1 Tax=Gracilibacillus halophilus TaxID=470864 RepID=UPI003B835804